jgi:hypothetical protein
MRAAPRALWAGFAAALALCFSIQVEAAPVKGGKKKPPPKSNTSPLAMALKSKAPQIQECVISNALDKGAKKVDIHVRVTVNKQGGVENTEIELTTDGGDKDKTKACGDGVVRGTTFPPVSTQLAVAEQSWTLAAQ